MTLLSRFRKLFFLTFLIIGAISYFYKDNYKAVDSIQDETILSPVQEEVRDNSSITFKKDNYSYTLDPLYDYTLNGLVLSTQKYDAWYSLSRTDKTFIKDVCIIWGDTLKNKSHQDKSLSIKQDFRFCLYSYRTNGLIFNSDELSNNHLIASSPEIEKKILAINPSDQVRMKGKLVNVHATALSSTEKYEAPEIDWKTSISRDDDGGGACEVFYVEDVEIIEKGNQIFLNLFRISLWGLVIIALLSILEFIIGFSNTKAYNKNYE